MDGEFGTAIRQVGRFGLSGLFGVVGELALKTELAIENIPLALRQQNRWLIWRNEGTKVPYRADGGGKASSTDPATWCSFEQAIATGESIGFALGDGYAGIDLDDCYESISSNPDATPANRFTWGSGIAEQFKSTYAEISPSGGGVKIFLLGRKPPLVGCVKKLEHGKLEIYDRGRWFAVTGARLDPHPSELADCGGALWDLCRQYLRPETPKPTTKFIPPNADSRNRIKRFDAYKKSLDPAVAGQGGHNATLRFVTECFRFGLSDREAWDQLIDFNGRCSPPWSVRELEHKLAEGRKLVEQAGDMGVRLAQERASQSVSAPKSKNAGSGCPKSKAAISDGGVTHPVNETCVKLGQRDPDTGRLVLSAKRTIPTCEAYLSDFHSHPDGRTLNTYIGSPFVWRNNRHEMIEPDAIRNALYPWLHDALRYTSELELVDFESNPTTVNAACQTILSQTYIPGDIETPVWLNQPKDKPPADELLVCKSHSVHLPTLKIIPPTPNLFVTASLDFDFDADADSPTKWLEFLDQIFPGDPDSIHLLQQWFGYLLTQDMRQEKMMLMIGQRRSGKGTVASVLQALVGRGNYASPTVGSLAGDFGLQQLIGKSVAFVGDARFSGDRMPIVVERLLTISGRDPITIERKFMSAVTVRLPTRFCFLTNETPRLNEASLALAGRFLLLRFDQSFYGREDIDLRQKLVAELPGILMWAIEGWASLRQNGRFAVPAASREGMQELEDTLSPITTFIRERCELGGFTVWVDDLFKAWQVWCKDQGRDKAGTLQSFGRDIRSAVSGVRVRKSTEQHRFYEGLRIKPEFVVTENK